MADRVAWLGMYDHPGQHAANDALWHAVAHRLRADGVDDVPDRLARELEPAAAWSHPGLLFGQICTRPLALLYPHLRVLGHPVYRGTAAVATHRSRIVVRADDPATVVGDLYGRRAAINDWGSNTGMALLRNAVAGLGDPFFGAVVATGSHRASAVAVATGAADVAALDEVSHAAFARHEPDTVAGLRTIGWSAAAATPAFVTGRATPVATVAALRMALVAVLADPGLADVRDVLGLADIVPVVPGLREGIVAAERAAGGRLLA